MNQSDEEKEREKEKQLLQKNPRNNVSWSESATKLLILERYEMKSAFERPKEKIKKIWAKVAKKVNEKGYNYSGEQC